MVLRPWMLAATCLLGCAPVERLARRGQFDDAMCAATYQSRDRERAEALVLEALDRRARPRIHLHAVPTSELEAGLKSGGARLAEQALLVRAVIETDEVHVDGFRVRVALAAGGRVVEAEPAERSIIAGYTGERLPQVETTTTPGRRRLVAERWIERPLMGAVAGTFEASTLFVVPITVITGHSRYEPGSTTYDYPTDEEYASAAPVTEAVFRAAQAARETSGNATAQVWLWPRPRTPDTRLVIEWGYQALGCESRRPAFRERSSEGSSELTRRVELVLPDGPDLASRINARFGDRMMPLTAGTSAHALH